VAWVETELGSFSARHAERDADEAARVLDALERTRRDLEPLFPRAVPDVAVVLHESPLALGLAVPVLPVLRRLTSPAGRRYLVGWCSPREVHVLSPRLLAQRASNVPGSLELLMLAPRALYVRLLIGAHSPRLPPPLRPRSVRSWLRWAWLAEGAAQWLSGQTPHARPAIARRLREGPPPAFPPDLRDATLLGGTVVDLLAREAGPRTLGRLLTELNPDGAGPALVDAFGGRSLRRSEDIWRSHLRALTSGAPADTG
jgi:hypothetical protein